MNRELEIQIRKEKAKKLRYKRAILRDMNLYAIKDWAYEASNACYEYAYADMNNYEELVNSLDGDTEEASAYQLAFSSLESDLGRFMEDLDEKWVPECFDDFILGICGDYDSQMVGYDEFEGDYFGLREPWERECALNETKERLTKIKKSDLIEAAGQCIRIALSYMALKHRMDDLEAAAEIVRGLNNGLLRDVQAVNRMYEEWSGADWRMKDEKEKAFSRILAELPQEVWVR
ncbi:MAG: hypothetical protein ACI4O4_00885 [Candidatus Ventricola sp.]